MSPPCRTYQGRLTTFACKRKVIESRGRGPSPPRSGVFAFVPRFQEKTVSGYAEPFHDLGCLCCGRTDNAEELRHERTYLSGRTRRRDWCGALVPGPALIGYLGSGAAHSPPLRRQCTKPPTRGVSATLLKAHFVPSHRSSSVRNALSVANQRRSWTSRLGR